MNKFLIPSKERRAQEKDQRDELSQYIKDSKLCFDLKFIDIKEIHPQVLDKTFHQIIILFSTGRMQTLPVGVLTKNQIKKHLGVRVSRITHFAVLPIPGTASHIKDYGSLNKGNITKDVLNYE